MANHTPEPWFIAEEPLILLNEICGNDENGEPFIIVSRNYNYSDLSNANARRIVLCVNACAGIPDEALNDLDGTLNKINAAIEINRSIALADDAKLASVTAQRDELAGIIMELRQFSAIATKEMTTSVGDYVELFERAVAAIAKCEVQNGK